MNRFDRLTLALILLGAVTPALAQTLAPLESASNGISLVSDCPKLEKPADDSFTAMTNLSYGSFDGVEQKLDLYVPKQVAKAPLVILIHGGGFYGGNRAALTNEAKLLTTLGYAAATIDYPLVHRDPATHQALSQFPRNVQGARCALRFLKAKAEKFHLDPLRVVVRGGSAGATISATLATADTEDSYFDAPECAYNKLADARVAGSINQYGIYDFGLYKDNARDMSGVYLGKEKASDPGLVRRASVYYMLTAHTPPMLLGHGRFDQLVSPQQSQALFARTRELGIKSAFIVSNNGHGGGIFGAGGVSPQYCTARAFLASVFAAK